jgi:hypothetical protein
MKEVPSLLYESKTWVKNKNVSKTETAEITFLRCVNVCTKADQIENEDFMQNLYVTETGG